MPVLSQWPRRWSAPSVRPTRVDIIDDTFIAAAPTIIAPLLQHPGNQRSWWPHLELQVQRERGAKGAEWAIRGHIVGSMEVWLEPFWDGTIVHHYVRGTVAPVAPRDVALRHVRRWKHAVTRLKDTLESGIRVSAAGPAQ